MPLPNRVDPFGNLFADPARGLFFGNRGGRFHRDDRTLGARRWVSRSWICCRLAFKGRHRNVWAAGYTELFFLDEPTALAAGHRPCFECRRADARAFAAAYAAGSRQRGNFFGVRAPDTRPEPGSSARVPRAPEIDRVLHAERLMGRAKSPGRTKRRHRLTIDGLPDGAFLTLPDEPDQAFAVRGSALLWWTPRGYAARRPRPGGIVADVLTPPGILAALASGYRPLWHPSADDQSVY
jgi:hypothetical protein